MPKFSIIIPVFNVAPYLHECLDSVSAQTCTNWEAICVDDGSSDGSGAILDEYAEKDSRFSIIHQQNAGVSVARNAALDVVRGEWVCFLDSDDVVGKNWLLHIHEATIRYPSVDWVRTRYRDLIEGKEPQPWPESSINCEEVGFYERVTPFMWNRLDKLGMPWLNIFKRSIIGDLRFEIGLNLYEDIVFCAEMIRRATSFCVIPADDYLYRIRHGSAAHSYMEFSQIYRGLSSFLRSWKKSSGTPGALTLRFRRSISRCHDSGCRFSLGESFRLRHLLCKYWVSGAFSFHKVPSRKLKIRWGLFFVTGCSAFLWSPLNLCLWKGCK